MSSACPPEVLGLLSEHPQTVDRAQASLPCSRQVVEVRHVVELLQRAVGS